MQPDGRAWAFYMTLMATALLAGWTTLGVVLGLSYGVMLTFSVVGLVGSLVMLARYHSTRGQVEVAV